MTEVERDEIGAGGTGPWARIEPTGVPSIQPSLEHPDGDRRGGVLRGPDAEDLLRMGRGWPVVRPLPTREEHLVDPRCAPLFAHHVRSEAAGPVPRHSHLERLDLGRRLVRLLAVALVALGLAFKARSRGLEMLGQLRFACGLDVLFRKRAFDFNRCESYVNPSV